MPSVSPARGLLNIEYDLELDLYCIRIVALSVLSFLRVDIKTHR